MSDTHDNLYAMGRKVPTELIRFGAALSDAECLGDGWRYFLERPEKYEAEFKAWAAAGYPSEGDGEPWDEFCDEVGAMGWPA